MLMVSNLINPTLEKPLNIGCADAFLSSSGESLQIDWSTDEQFGGYNLFKKGNRVYLDNEQTTRSTVGAILKKAFLEMLYIEYESLERIETPMTYEQCRDYFRTPANQFTVYLTPHQQFEDDNSLCLGYFFKSNLEEVVICIKKDKLPVKEIHEDENSYIGTYIQRNDWQDMFENAMKVTWKRVLNKEPEFLPTYKDVQFVNLFFEDGNIDIYWKTPFESGRLSLAPHAYLSVMEINTFGKSREFVMQVLDSMIKKIVLTD